MSGADEKMRAVIEHVAWEANKASHSWAADKANTECVLEVLERRLLPLLLAGQAMREVLSPAEFETLNAKVVTAWERALAAAQGQPEKESGR